MFKKNFYSKLFLCLILTILISPITAFSSEQADVKGTYTCTLDLANDYCDCDHQIDLIWDDFDKDRAVMRIDMENKWGVENAELKMKVWFKDPNGWVMNLGNSNTNNGWAGDGGTFSCDSEFDLRVNADSGRLNTLSVYSNDFAEIINRHLLVIDDFFPFLVDDPDKVQQKIQQAEFIVKDHHMSVKSLSCWSFNVKIDSEYLFRLNHSDIEGYPDWIYWLGVNRVVHPINGASYRNGSGITKIEFTLSTWPSASPPPPPPPKPIKLEADKL